MMLLAGLTVFVYRHSLTDVFVFDDVSAVLDNRSIQHLWPPWSALTPAADATTGGRPWLNLSFAFNYAVGGRQAWGYHLVNVLIHLGAGLVLFALVRRAAVAQSLARKGTERAAVTLAAAVAGIWLLHPLGTASVSYVSQRAEALMALFYLLTLHAFVRGVEESAWRWRAWSVVACGLGMMTKEVMVTAPLMVWFVDRTWFAGSWREAWRRRAGYYLALGATWLLLGWSLSSGLANRTVGYGLGLTWWQYALIESQAIARYLALAGWPHPLVFDYGPVLSREVGGLLPYAATLAVVLAAVVWLNRRRSAIGFWPASFLLVLAPTSSVVPVAEQPIAENRVYLALIPLVAAGVLGWRALLGRRAWPGVVGVALVLGGLTLLRNGAYRDAETLWRDTLAKVPDNPRAHDHLGRLLAQRPGRQEEARAHFETALRLRPDFAQAHNNLAMVLAERPEGGAEALRHYAEAIRLKPDLAPAHNNYAILLATLPGREEEARAHYAAALRLKPDYAEAHNNLGTLLARWPDRHDEARAHLAAALRLNPEYAEAHFNLALLLASRPDGQEEAQRHFSAAVRLRPDHWQAHYQWALLLAGRPEGQAAAVEHLETALRLEPDAVEARHNLAVLLARQPARWADARAHYERVLQLRRDWPVAHNNLANLLAEMPGGQEDALAHYLTALRLDPDYADAHHNAALLLAAMPARHAAAAEHFAAVVRLRPNDPRAHFNYARQLETLPGRTAEAAEHYAVASRLDPSFAAAHAAWARLRR